MKIEDIIEDRKQAKKEKDFIKENILKVLEVEITRKTKNPEENDIFKSINDFIKSNREVFDLIKSNPDRIEECKKITEEYEILNSYSSVSIEDVVAIVNEKLKENNITIKDLNENKKVFALINKAINEKYKNKFNRYLLNKNLEQ